MKIIDYSKIDKKCIEMIKFFNEIGLITKFSCQGHDNGDNNSFEIIFDNSIEDNDVLIFLEKYSNKYNHTPFIGKFTKWMRKIDDEIVSNWIYSISYGNYKVNQVFARMDLEKMKSGFHFEEDKLWKKV